ncbi:hypothetical protein J40TS1_18990 [Paenibacillus montaniterrae]|uniref:Lipoprotein n=1 Tax=Paenibacillus montaniterrae TaxID=429341 RepID=A0A919YN56_9BACL|nr:hypothetical protein [Paenibacillus montaniterrae]GIP16257.1 hypothetical protein J40TS1_18990 [Paenibacillus montaniterrae]
MRIVTIICFISLIFLLSSCETGPQNTISSNELNGFSDKLELTYGNGHTKVIEDLATRENLIELIKSNQYKRVNKPDSVGQSFTIQLQQNLRYTSPGYLHNGTEIYKATDIDIVTKIQKLISELK